MFAELTTILWNRFSIFKKAVIGVSKCPHTCLYVAFAMARSQLTTTTDGTTFLSDATSRESAENTQIPVRDVHPKNRLGRYGHDSSESGYAICVAKKATLKISQVCTLLSFQEKAKEQIVMDIEMR